MRLLLTSMLAASLTLAGCASSSVTGGATSRTDGLGADLRVFLDDSCLPPAASNAGSLGPFGFGATTLGEIAVGTGEILFKSFGRYLEEAGQPDIDTSSGVASALFYSGNPADEGFGDLARDIRCIHIVRNGFDQRPGTDADGQPYAHLGLISKPSFYALIRLDPPEDRSAFFRGHLMHMQVNRFERAGGEVSRDFVISLNFGAPAYGSSEVFAVGTINLPGMTRARTLGEAETRGLATSWLNTPYREDTSERYAFNLYVDVVESKRGNPFLADIGRLLQSEPVVGSVSQDIAEVVTGDRSRQRDEADYLFALRSEERRLRRDLEDALRALIEIRDDEFADDQSRLFGIRAVEDASDAIARQRAAEGRWLSGNITALLQRAQATIQEVQTLVDAPDGE